MSAPPEEKDQTTRAPRETTRRNRIGIALGGGGARGLAHVLMLEALDELGVRPYRIAGTSIGAVLGALYASGHSGNELRALVTDTLKAETKSWSHALVGLNVLRWIDLVDPDLGKEGLISTERFIDFLHKAIRQSTFEELETAMKVVAADFWTGEQVVFESGELLPAVRASMALPVVFAPVLHGGRILVDGGAVNPLPYDLLLGECSTTIAVDVSGTMPGSAGKMPSFSDAIFHSFHIMEQAILAEKLKRRTPDVYIRPDIRDVRALDFSRPEEVYRQAAPAKEELKRKLVRMLS